MSKKKNIKKKKKKLSKRRKQEENTIWRNNPLIQGIEQQPKKHLTWDLRKKKDQPSEASEESNSIKIKKKKHNLISSWKRF